MMDMDPALDGRSREVAVKILADVQPVPPTGNMFEPVEFEGLVVTPYANERYTHVAAAQVQDAGIRMAAALWGED
jgi:hypothetical protein